MPSVLQAMKVLVACEESQAVTKAFRAKGHEAYSCDVQDCSGGHPEWHIKGDVLKILDDGWDLMIAHPPCTYLANSGVHHLHKNPGRWDKLKEGVAFFKAFLDAPIKKICVENPIPHKYAIGYSLTLFGESDGLEGQRPNQIVQPWQFGHPESKATCLWLKGLPNLYHTKVLTKPTSGVWDNQTKSGQNKLPPSKHRAKLRSKTYEGIADAMAEQWGIHDA